MGLWTLSFWAFWINAPALNLSPSYNFASSLQSFYQTQSVEELATGTITIRGPFDDTVLQILQTTTEQTLKLFCSQGSILIFTELKVLSSGGGQRIVTMEFQILPPRDGGGDCAWELLQAAAGRDTPPFEECEQCPNKKPVIRRAILNQLEMYSLTRGLSVNNWYLSMFSIFCRRLQVTMPVNFPSMTKKDYRCEDFAPEATRHPGSPGTTTTGTPGTALTTTDRVDAESSVCTWMRDPCLCATVTTCSWLPDGEGISRCTEVSTSPHLSQRCASCPSLPECPPDPVRECPLALTICGCALLSAGCNWTVDEGRCFAPASGPSGVDCALCPFAAETCPMPRISSISPSFGSEMGFDGPYGINVTFDRPVRDPIYTDALQGEMQLTCELQDSQYLPAQAPDHRRANFVIQFPPSKRVKLSDEVVQLPLGNEDFWSGYQCKLDITRAAMVSVVDDTPCLENLNHLVFIRDNVPPSGVIYTPRVSERDVALDTVAASMSLTEPWSLQVADAQLWRFDPAGRGQWERVRLVPMSKSETSSVVEQLLLALGDLEADTLFSIVIPAGALVDRSGNRYGGLQAGDWVFRTAMAVGVVMSQDDALSPGAITGIVLGIVAFIGATILCIAIWRCKLIAKFENCAVKPEEGSTPKASQVSALHNDSELLPSNEKFWEKALVNSKENLTTDELEDMPLTLPGTVGSNRRPSNASNQRRPSNASTNQRRPSVGTESIGARRPSRTSNQAVGSESLGARRPSRTSNQLLEPSNQRHASKQSAGSRGRRPSEGTASLGVGSANLDPPEVTRSRSPSVDRSEGVTRLGRTQEESESLAASRRAMLGAGPATLSKPTTPARVPAARQTAT